jgi:release factor glutamine methyltransferase
VIVRLPGIYAPQHDTALLIRALRASGLAPGRHILDICTGTGVVAVAAAAMGAASVTAIDLSRRAVMSARANSFVRRADVVVRRGNLFAPIADERFDLVLCNPPYVPAISARLPRHTRGRSWDAGPDGRALVDRVCECVVTALRPGGTLLLTHTAVIGAEVTLAQLAAQGLSASVVMARRVPFGPVMTKRSNALVAKGLIGVGEQTEELVVIAATAPSAATVTEASLADSRAAEQAYETVRLAG